MIFQPPTIRNLTIADELHEGLGIPVLISASIQPADVMFGMADLQADDRAHSWLMSLADWHHQDEVVVHVHAPLQILSIERLNR